MKRIICVFLFAVFALCGCKDKNGEDSANSTVPATAASEAAVSTEPSSETAVTSTSAAITTTASAETTSSVSSGDKELIEDGIIPPEAEEMHTDDGELEVTFPVSEDDEPIELPIIPIR